MLILYSISNSFILTKFLDHIIHFQINIFNLKNLEKNNKYLIIIFFFFKIHLSFYF
jgi:hypothetical protein